MTTTEFIEAIAQEPGFESVLKHSYPEGDQPEAMTAALVTSIMNAGQNMHKIYDLANRIEKMDHPIAQFTGRTLRQLMAISAAILVLPLFGPSPRRRRQKRKRKDDDSDQTSFAA